MDAQEFVVKPIGHVRAGENGFCLEIDPAYAPALQGLQGFGYVVVVWWCHLLDGPEYRQVLTCQQPYKEAPAEMGIFATRAPVRPNPIAVTPVAVLNLDVERGIITIPYIDAEDGTPILDLKPYYPCIDRVRDVQVPAWCAAWPQWYEDSATFDWSAVFVNAR